MTTLKIRIKQHFLNILIVYQQIEEQGVDPNSKDNDHATPIHFAASRGHLETLKWLLKHGARITMDKFGKSPLNDAAENEHMEVSDPNQSVKQQLIYGLSQCLALLVSHASNGRYNGEYYHYKNISTSSTFKSNSSKGAHSTCTCISKSNSPKPVRNVSRM